MFSRLTRSDGAPVFELELDGRSLQGGTLRNLLSMELKESVDQLDALTVRLNVPERAEQVLKFTRPGVVSRYSRRILRSTELLDSVSSRSMSKVSLSAAPLPKLRFV